SPMHAPSSSVRRRPPAPAPEHHELPDGPRQHRTGMIPPRTPGGNHWRVCVEARVEPQDTQDVVRVLSALSDANRYRIVELLAPAGELSCGALGTALGLSPSLISHPLSVLESASVIQRRKDGLGTLNRRRRDELARRLSGLQRIVATEQ